MRFKWLISVLVLLFTSFAGVVAHAEDIFTVKDISISANGKDATEARQMALLQGEKDAFTQLLGRIAPSADVESVTSSLQDDDISSLVRGLEVQKENVARTSYSAVVDISFYPEYVKAKLDELGVPYSIQSLRPVLVLPIELHPGEPLKVDANSQWAAAWKRSGNTGSVLKFIVPDATDSVLPMIDPSLLAEQKYDYNKDGVLQSLAKRYGVREVLFAAIRYDAQSLAQDGYADVAVKLLGRDNLQGFSYKIVSQIGETAPMMLDRAVKLMVTRTEGVWKQTYTAEKKEKTNLKVTIPLHGIEDWLHMQNYLSGLSFVDSVDVKEISSEKAVVELQCTARGDLTGKFAEKGLYLEDKDGQTMLYFIQQKPQQNTWPDFGIKW